MAARSYTALGRFQRRETKARVATGKERAKRKAAAHGSARVSAGRRREVDDGPDKWDPPVSD
uniref:Uncharacterized protein n=1 Tax=Oryza sativa subsp. japonica TaxID=39947 RepID=Q6Z0C9_ORYSJ|nr:hypothetical protein [Oryza sativa Japonica Group]